jgi:mannosyl-oligosaccharide alpha-1,2-mannosidase
MTLRAWNGYKKYAWGKNELKPLSKQGHTAGIFGGAENLGASLVDAMDTLYIMDLKEEVAEATDWVKKNFNIKIV